MREGGLEPPIPVGNQILNLARLPIPPLSLSPPILVVSAQPLKPLSPYPQAHALPPGFFAPDPRLTPPETTRRIASPSDTKTVSSRLDLFSPFIPQGSPWLPATTQPVS